MTKSVLQTKNISKTFFTPSKISLFKNIDLVVKRGQSVAITGKSGQGKSTLLHILGTLESPSSGTLIIDDEEVSFWNRSKIRSNKVAFIFQSFHLMDEMSALSNVILPQKIKRSAIDKKQALSLLEKVGLEKRADFPAKLLSGGEKQRVAIARAFYQNPQVIFADEPSGNLDDESADVVNELLLSYVKERGGSLVLVTHDKKLASLTDTHLHLSYGHLEEA